MARGRIRLLFKVGDPPAPLGSAGNFFLGSLLLVIFLSPFFWVHRDPPGLKKKSGPNSAPPQWGRNEPPNSGPPLVGFFLRSVNPLGGIGRTLPFGSCRRLENYNFWVLFSTDFFDPYFFLGPPGSPPSGGTPDPPSVVPGPTPGS